MTIDEGGTGEDGTTPAARDVHALAGTFDLLISSRGGVTSVPCHGGRWLFVGRGAAADIRVQDPTISRTHASLFIDERVEIRELHSMNGLRVRGELLPPGSHGFVALGETFELGAVGFVVLRSAGQRSDTMPVTAEFGPEPTESGPVVADAHMLQLYRMVDVIARTTLNVLVLGETGTGKELVAESIHAKSQRANAPFLKMNCAALSESLIEPELFGYEKGAFTGATQSKQGLFEAASGGTLFLDEIADMPQSMQAKVLRVLESGEVMRVGALKPRQVDIRFVCATCKNLRQEVRSGRFRADLFFRINGVTVSLPPLRKRVAEIALLAKRFVKSAAMKDGRQPLELAPETVQLLERHSWPGNVRELKNTVARAFALARGPSIEPSDVQLEEGFANGTEEPPTWVDLGASTLEVAAALPSNSRPPPQEPGEESEPAPGLLRNQLDAIERDRIVDALERCNGNQSKAIQLLGISRFQLMTRMDRYGIARPRKRTR